MPPSLTSRITPSSWIREVLHEEQQHQHPGRAATERKAAVGGSRLDIRVEGDIATIINILYYLEFLDWKEAAERTAGGRAGATEAGL